MLLRTIRPVTAMIRRHRRRFSAFIILGIKLWNDPNLLMSARREFLCPDGLHQMYRLRFLVTSFSSHPFALFGILCWTIHYLCWWLRTTQRWETINDFEWFCKSRISDELMSGDGREGQWEMDVLCTFRMALSDFLRQKCCRRFCVCGKSNLFMLIKKLKYVLRN